MMLIYTPSINTRVRYACSIVFRDLIGSYQLTEDPAVFHKHDGFRIWYGDPGLMKAKTLIVYRDEQMWSETIKPVTLSPDNKRATPVIFSDDSEFGFDIFSACFFMLTRYEEYLPFTGDARGRFSSADSCLYAVGGHLKPLADLWIMQFQALLTQRFAGIRFRKNNYSFTSTFDIDSAFAYRHKGFVRTAGGYVKDILQFRIANMCNRTMTLMGLSADVYDTYDFIEEVHNRHSIKSIFFFLLADYGEEDKNVPHSSSALRALIRRVQKHSGIGIHPGMASTKSASKLQSEVSRLAEITGAPCTNSRQHYLHISFPDTFLQLLKTGITNEYSLGFADNVGFRAGTCRSFNWFDLGNNIETSLVCHPFMLMDATLNRYMMLSPDEAIREVSVIINEVKDVGGHFISLWHNESLSERNEWKGWRRVWESVMKMASG